MRRGLEEASRTDADLQPLIDSVRAASSRALPGYRLHQLTGDRKGQWSVRVSGNWRIVFKLKDGQVLDVDLVDYH